MEALDSPKLDEHSQALVAMNEVFQRQRKDYLANPYPDYTSRIRDLRKLAQLVQDHKDALARAISEDYGNRSVDETLFAEILPVLEGIQETIKHLRKWMRPERRRVRQLVYPLASNRLIAQPLGVVGVIVPWNFPINLAFSPLTSIFAAGNRALVKMSDRSPRLAAFLKRVVTDYFPREKLAFIDDGHQLGPEFSALPFDHLLFTGSTQTGKAVMASAATNLTPVTLELGGKSPAVVAPDFPLEVAAERILFWKLMNAGQICTNIDYLFLPESKVREFVELTQKIAHQRYPDLQAPDYTSIIDDRSYQRLWDTVADAQQKGTQVVNVFPGNEGDGALRKFPLHLLIEPNDDSLVMQREIFGPLLPIKTYRDPQEVIEYINSRERPLAFYPFTRNKSLRDLYLQRVMSGGACVNNCLLHVAQHDLPFGGVGHSGIGHYHGKEGFINFSKLRPVHYQGFIDGLKPLMPPYGEKSRKILEFMIRRARS
ncbi:coniferyl aldehyde dehydrogenase [Microbulbifer salipaludis]|uniref:Aldehyde dehydrogenase n=1 Tax=Microbulbifer salipaludis TaxID=187980 RepID=A0ABS3E2Y1_9GAMM|nr:coniferyl aldehyde dehydrogenase [Microbulbifer salipaludis]MBN8429665.1 coniferyl aldehyde dehydrogenase [Microbulbifer salipaludis]